MVGHPQKSQFNRLFENQNCPLVVRERVKVVGALLTGAVSKKVAKFGFQHVE